jgi:sugar lactone lactonase YvrE
LIVDTKGEIWIADTGNRLIRTLGTQAQMRTSAGGKTEGSVDGPLNEALFNTPSGLAFDGQGNLFVADEDNHAIRKITPNGDVSTVAGTGVPGFLDGPGKTALFDSPHCVAVNSQGAVFVSDRDNHRIRKIDAQGDVTTFAGQAIAGLADGMGGIAKFSAPYGLVFDKQDNLYVADSDNHVIRKIDPQGNVVTFAGTGSRGYQDGPSATARFDTPYGLAFDGTGNLYVADYGNHRIRKIDPQGVISTVAGTGNNGYSDGAALQAEFDRPTSIVLDPQGNLFIVDQNNERIRQLDTTGKVTTLAGTGTAGFQDGPLNQAQFDEPFGITIDAKGTLYIGDRENYSIRRILR